MDNLTKEQRHRNMQAIKSKKTKLDNNVMTCLWQNGYRFGKNVKDLEGKPDIAIKKYKLVIFIDSCFWHKCHIHYKLPATNVEFWENKLYGNKERDERNQKELEEMGWNVIIVWECELKKDKAEQTLENLYNQITSEH